MNNVSSPWAGLSTFLQFHYCHTRTRNWQELRQINRQIHLKNGSAYKFEKKKQQTLLKHKIQITKWNLIQMYCARRWKVLKPTLTLRLSDKSYEWQIQQCCKPQHNGNCVLSRVQLFREDCHISYGKFELTDGMMHMCTCVTECLLVCVQLRTLLPPVQSVTLLEMTEWQRYSPKFVAVPFVLWKQTCGIANHL